MDFSLTNIYGPAGTLLRSRLYSPDGATAWDLPLTESGLTGVFAGSVTLFPDPAESVDPDDAYEYEVRIVATQDSAGFNASTSEVITRGFYGYLIDGEWAGGWIDTSSDPISPYFTYAEFERRFGRRNISRYSNPDNDSVDLPNHDRVQDAFDAATDLLHGFFASGPYKIPFEFSGTVPSVVRRWAMNLAYADLYLARGMSDEKQPTKIQMMVRNTANEMALYRGGLREISTASRRSEIDSTPGSSSLADVWSSVWACRYPDQQPTYGWIFA